MKKGIYTIWIFRSGGFSPRKIKLPWFVAKTLPLIVLVIIFAFPFITYDLVAKRQKLTTIAKETSEQTAQIVSLNKQLGEFHQQFQKLREFDIKLRIIANLENAKETGPFLGVGGLAYPHGEPGQDSDTDLHTMRTELDRLSTEAEFREKSFEELYSVLEGKKEQLACTPSIWPVRGWLTSRMGYRIDPFTGQRHFHEGIDIANRRGAPIICPADGVVSRIRKYFTLGLTMEIKHGYGIVTRYGHLDRLHVKVGQKVKRGQRIAALGNTGRSTGPHVHYEVRLNGVPVNPLRYILN